MLQSLFMGQTYLNWLCVCLPRNINVMQPAHIVISNKLLAEMLQQITTDALDERKKTVEFPITHAAHLQDQ